MAIHPIDLSSIYGQMDNVAKFNASADKVAALVGNIQQNKDAQKGLQQTKIVHQVARNELETGSVKEDGSNGSQLQGETKRGEEKDTGERNETGNKQWEITDPALGQHIDITT